MFASFSAPIKAKTKADLQEEMKLIKQLNIAVEEEVDKNDEAIANLEKKMKVMIEKHDDLDQLNKKKIKIIKTLKDKIILLQQQQTPGLNYEKLTSECQTFQEQIQILCNLCLYIATCEEQLNWHMGEDHDLSSDSYFDTDYPCDICGKWSRSGADLVNHLKKHEENNKDNTFGCNLCSDSFREKNSLMIHKKNIHKEKVSTCWDYSTGKCDLGDEIFWFIHSESSIESKFKCSICEKVFDHHNDLILSVQQLLKNAGIKLVGTEHIDDGFIMIMTLKIK